MAKRNTFAQDEVLETPFNAKNLLRCKPYVLHNIKWLLVGLFLSIAATVFGLLGPVYTQTIIDDMIPDKNVRGVIFIALLYFITSCMAEFCAFFQSLVTSRAGHQIFTRSAPIFSSTYKNFPLTISTAAPEARSSFGWCTT